MFVPHLIISNGGTVTQPQPDGSKLFVAPDNDRTLEAMNYIRDLVEVALINVLNGPLEEQWEALNIMANGGAMFIPGYYEHLRRLTRQEPPTNYSFGLLPMPKGNHMPDFTVSTHNSEQFYIVQDVSNAAEIAAVLVAMANRTSKINIIYTEMNFGVQDMDSLAVLEMMLEPGRWVMDYSRLCSARNRVTEAINAVLNGHWTPRQAFDMMAPTIQGNYDALLRAQQ